MPRKKLDDNQRGELIDALLSMRSVLAEPGVFVAADCVREEVAS